MKKNNKSMPTFRTEAEEQKFWQEHDATEYFDFANAKQRVTITFDKSVEAPVKLISIVYQDDPGGKRWVLTRQRIFPA